MTPRTLLTHPGGAHKDDLLACAVLIAEFGAPLQRREPIQTDLDDPETFVIDVGGEHDPARGNFDHHQFPRDATPLCALSLVLQHLGLYEDARAFCDWMEPAEWFDCRGPKGTAEWLGVERRIITQLSSPIDHSLMRRFAQARELQSGDTLYEVLRFIGEDLLDYLRSLRKRLGDIAKQASFWTIEGADGAAEVLFMPRTDPLPDEPSHGMPRFIHEQDKAGSVIAMIYPDRRGAGYGLTRFEDHPSMDFTRIDGEADVHFAHASGFVAKTSATDPARLKELVELAVIRS